MTSLLEVDKQGQDWGGVASCATPPLPALPAFSIAGIPAGNPLTELRKRWIDRIDREKQEVRVSVYPSGVEIHTGKDPQNPPPEGVTRGKITGFSEEAKRRLKRAFLTLYVPDFEIRAVTLTTHRKMDRKDYQAALKRFAERIKVCGWAAIIRHEVQRRGAPHSHLALWTPAGVTPEQVRDLWLECTGESGDKAARAYAVKVRELSQDEAGWVIYMAKHDAKEDEVQSAWGGKHWSIWNQRILKERTPENFTLDQRQHSQLLRVLRGHQIALRRSDVAKLERAYRCAQMQQPADGVPVAQFVPMSDGVWLALDENGNILGQTADPHGKILGADEKQAWLRLRRNRVAPLHRGDLLRLIPGEVISRVARGILDGSLYGSPAGSPF